MAEIAGYVVPVVREGREVRFELAGVRGAFRGHIFADAKEIRGFWMQPRSATNATRNATSASSRA